MKSTDDIGARLRVLIDRVRDKWMRELQQRSTATPDEQAEIGTELPRDRVRAEDPRAWICDVCTKLRQ
jgi:hypothetical protein